MFKGINWVAVIAATVVVWVLGYICFGVVFANAYGQLAPASPAIGMNANSFALVVPVFVSIVVLAWVLVKTGSTSLESALATTFVVCIGFDTTVYAANYLTGGAPLQLMAMLAVFDLVTYLIAAVILTLLKGKAAA